MADQPRRELDLGPLEMWTLGAVATVMPKYNRRWPKPLRAAWRRRLMANLTGVCECGGEMRAIAGTLAGQMGHVGDCPAADDVIAPMLEAES